MPTVGVNPPKSPVTKGSSGVAVAAVPNVCKMPGPPAPFVPTPLPNIGKSGDSPKGYTKKVKVEGYTVAIRGATFGSMGDMASKATGGGIVSANTHGPTAFVSPGSMDVSFEGKAVQLLGDAMTNNNGSPPNSSTPMEGQGPATPLPPCDLGIDCKQKKNNPEKGKDPWDDCMIAQVCEMVKAVNAVPKDQLKKISPSPSKTKLKVYQAQLNTFKDAFASKVAAQGADGADVKGMFYDPPPPNDGCAHKKWKDGGASPTPSGRGTGKFNPDHSHPVSLGGSLSGISGMKWADARVNVTVGKAMDKFDPAEHGSLTAPDCCD
ncbi:MAG: DUF4150 domain-containing protein [Myxococcales bacterium]|nr:DUF4150 domain-containing protein [Myxococcales bacterium]MCB9714273.1 DUF4150 domain-containing protein [Myxococcales bacterium]